MGYSDDLRQLTEALEKASLEQSALGVRAVVSNGSIKEAALLIISKGKIVEAHCGQLKGTFALKNFLNSQLLDLFLYDPGTPEIENISEDLDATIVILKSRAKGSYFRNYSSVLET